jgi:hypothetical protein
MADLFQTTPQNVTLHIGAIYQERELLEKATCKEYLQVRQEGSRQVSRHLKHYNLNMIPAVGYRVRAPRGTQFRQWATGRLAEYLVKGFAMDDERLKQAGGGDYFDELLARIRDIRSSERLFWRKVLDIYATSIDYDPSAEASQKFFAVVQNKMHWAAHGQTAAEVIARRADGTKPNMGLTTWTGNRPRRADGSLPFKRWSCRPGRRLIKQYSETTLPCGRRQRCCLMQESQSSWSRSFSQAHHHDADLRQAPSKRARFGKLNVLI